MAITKVDLANVVTGVLPVANGGTGTSTGVAPGGSTTQVQYNNAGAFGGSANLTFDGYQLTVYGITVGRGGAGGAANTAFGNTAIPIAPNSGVTAIGSHAGAVFNTASDTGQSTFVGYYAGAQVSTGTDNTFVGGSVGTNTTTGAKNTAIGSQALQLNTTANYNTAVGYQAGYSNQTGAENTFVGKRAGYASTANYNTAVGADALSTNTTGANNSAFGLNALADNTTGSYNVGLGLSALKSNTTSSYNTAVGYQAGYGANPSSNSYHSYFGYQAGYAQTTGLFNTMVGAQAGFQATTGSQNTFIGQGAGYYVTTGGKNTVLGCYNGNQGGLDIRTASNYIVLSDGDGNPRQIIDSSGGLLVGCTGGAGSAGVSRFYTDTTGDSMKIFNVQGSSSNFTLLSCFSNASTPSSPTGTIRFNLVTNGGIQNYSANNVNLSDIREKTDIELADGYLDKICSIPVKTFNYIDQNMEDDQGKTLGVIAQDVEAVAPELVKNSNWGTKEQPKMRLSIYQTDLQYALMKCIQELKAEVDSLKQQLATK